LTAVAGFLLFAAPALADDAKPLPTIHEAAADDTLPDRHRITIPTVDISGDANPEHLTRHVVLAAGSGGKDWQHPHMLL
jgi:hypothetical protein